jgi:hypothetical protein
MGRTALGLKSWLSPLLLTLVLNFGASSAHAWVPKGAPEPERQTVVLLTSLDMSRVHIPWFLFFMRPYYEHYPQRLESAFREHFQNRGYNVVVQHDADQAVLWRALHYPGSVAVYWLSHAGDSGPQAPGLSGGAVIVDRNGYDVTPVFQDVHPNLRFLAVIGCDSQHVLEQQLHSGISENPDLRLISFDHKVDAQDGLKRALEVGDRYLGLPSVRRGYEPECATRQGYEVVVTRKLPCDNASEAKTFPAVRLENSGRVLGVFTATRGCRTQRLKTYLDESMGPVRAFELKLVEDSGTNAYMLPTDLELGELDFSEPWSGAQWRLFADSSGHAIGVTTHVYRYTGPDRIDSPPDEYEPFECLAMPPLGR